MKADRAGGDDEICLLKQCIPVVICGNCADEVRVQALPGRLIPQSSGVDSAVALYERGDPSVVGAPRDLDESPPTKLEEVGLFDEAGLGGIQTRGKKILRICRAVPQLFRIPSRPDQIRAGEVTV